METNTAHRVTPYHRKLHIEDTREVFDENNSWGLSTAIDLHSCNPRLIRDAGKIKDFTIELCDLIKVKRFGECIIVHFGESEEIQGFSLVQLIETSLISGHFANMTNNAYIDIFSCKFYEPAIAIEFCKTFFEAKEIQSDCILRK